jgi:hypothetical protein
MIWICRPCKISCVTLVAICVDQLVVVVHVARGALRADMSPGQWETCRRMIKRGPIPMRR